MKQYVQFLQVVSPTSVPKKTTVGLADILFLEAQESIKTIMITFRYGTTRTFLTQSPKDVLDIVAAHQAYLDHQDVIQTLLEPKAVFSATPSLFPEHPLT